MGLVRAETDDLYRGGLPINPLPARKGETFDWPWHIATVDKKEYNNVVLKIKYLYVHA